SGAQVNQVHVRSVGTITGHWSFLVGSAHNLSSIGRPVRTEVPVIIFCQLSNLLAFDVDDEDLIGLSKLEFLVVIVLDCRTGIPRTDCGSHRIESEQAAQDPPGRRLIIQYYGLSLGVYACTIST